MIHELDSAASIAAQEANMAAFWAAYSQVPDRERSADGELVRVLTGVPSPQMNGVYRAQLRADSADAAIAATRDYFSAHGVPMLWWLGPGAQPADLGARLERGGFVAAGDVPLMAFDLSALAPAPPSPELTIRRVEGAAELAAWTEIVAVSFGFSKPAAARFHELEQSLGLADTETRYRFLAYLRDQPVATSCLFLDAGIAGIYVVATLPAARRQGVGGAITLAPLEAAQALGYRIATLQASTMGEPVYRRLGFKHIGAFQLYAGPPQGSAQHS